MKITRLKRQLPLPNSFIGGNFYVLHLLVVISTFCLCPILLLAVKSAPGIHSDYLQPIILKTFRPTKSNGFLYTAFWKLSWTTWSNCLSSSEIDFCFKFTSDTKQKIPKDFSFQSVESCKHFSEASHTQFHLTLQHCIIMHISFLMSSSYLT